MMDQAPREAQYDQFVSLLARTEQRIRRFVRSLMPTRDGIEDVMQDVALECWHKFEDFAPRNSETAEEDFVRWAFVISRFKVLSRQRDHARKRFVFRESVIEQLAQDSTSQESQRDAEKVAVSRCLDNLGVDERRLLLSVHMPGDSVSKIAEESGQNARRLYSKVNALRAVLLQCVQAKLAEDL